MTNDLQQQAREAAIDHGMWLAPDDDETNYQAFVAGYLRGYSDRGVEAASARDEYEKELATLRARVALLEEYAALLVESERLMLPLFVSHGCRFPEDMIKRGERLRSALMVPPIPMPGAEE